MDILLTRHGQTEWNVLKKVQGKANIALNETGENQALITAQNLIDEEIDLIISSPLKRALQTAEIINKTKNIPLIIDERISERDFGENIKDFFDRIYNFLDEIKETYKNKRILIVTHGGVSIPIKCYFSEIPDMDTLLPLCIGNCEVEKIENI